MKADMTQEAQDHQRHYLYQSFKRRETPVIWHGTPQNAYPDVKLVGMACKSCGGPVAWGENKEGSGLAHCLHCDASHRPAGYVPNVTRVREPSRLDRGAK